MATTTKNTKAAKSAKKTLAKATTAGRSRQNIAVAGGCGALAPIVAPGSPTTYRARVRMYRHGLGDCFLMTFPRKGKAPFQMLIDCGVLARDKDFMTRHRRSTSATPCKDGKPGRRRTSTSSSRRTSTRTTCRASIRRGHVFNDEFDFGAVWLGWTENLTKPEIKKIKEAKKKAIAKLQAGARQQHGGAGRRDLRRRLRAAELQFRRRHQRQREDRRGARVSEAARQGRGRPPAISSRARARSSSTGSTACASSSWARRAIRCC